MMCVCACDHSVLCLLVMVLWLWDEEEEEERVVCFVGSRQTFGEWLVNCHFWMEESR